MNLPTVRKELEAVAAEVRRTEGFTRAILDAAMDAVIAIAGDGRVLEFSAAAERMFGWTRDEALGRDLAELVIPPELREAHRQGLRRAVAGGATALAGRRVEMPGLRRDGTRLEVELTVVRIPEAEPPAFAATLRDIGERARRDRELREANERFRLVARATNDAVWDWDLDADTVWWNETFEALFGYARRETKPSEESWSNHIHPEDRDPVVEGIHAVLAGKGQSWSAEYRFRRRDGGYADVYDRGFVVRDEAGRAVRMIGAMADLTERNAATRALRASQQRFRALLELSSDWYWEQDEDLRFLPGRQSNEREALRPTDYVGKTRWEAANASLEDPRWAAHKAQLERREPFRDFEFGRKLADGTWRWVGISGEPVFDADGRFRGYRGVGKNIGARKQVEAEREKISRAYAALSTVNELVARAGSEEELLRGACEVAVSSGDFLFAVARRVERETATARLVALAGSALPDSQKRPLDLAPGSADARSLIARAYRSGRPVVLSGEEIAAETLLGDLARDLGVRAGAAYPLLRNGECIGALLLWSRDEQAFAGESGALFERMAGNVSLGLEILEKDEALRRFRLAFDSSADLVGLVDRASMRFVDVNETLCRELGYSRAEMLAMSPDQVLPFSRAELESSYDNLIAQPARPLPVRSHYIRRDGSHLPFDAKRHAIRSGGRWVIVGVGRDMRGELEAEEALRRTGAYFRSLIENASDAVAAVDMDWRYLYVSPAIATLTGYTMEEHQGRRFGEASIAEAASIRAKVEAALAAGPGPQQVTFDCRRRDGALRTHESVISRGVGPDGAPIYVIISRDITDRIAAEEALRRREEEFRAVAENAPDGIMRFDAQMRCLYANSAVAKSSGWAREQFLGRRLDDFAVPDEIKRSLQEKVALAFATGETQTVDFRFAGPRGERHYHARLAPEAGPGGRPVSVLGISRDVTELKRAERAMAESEARLRSIVEATAQPLLLADRLGTTLFANPAAAALFGRPVASLEGAPLGLPLVDGRPADVEILLPDGAIRPAEMQFAATQLDGREVLVVSLHDLSERKRFEEHIQHLATHDDLTGLPNRAVLGDRIEQAIVNVKRGDSTLALLFVDLDQFKLVNDSFGHPAGDALLVEIAGRLSATVREGDTVARLGGDEFVVLLTNLKRPEDSAVVARKIAAALEAPVVLEAGELRASASIGIAVYPEDGESLEALLQCADAAMYRAKDAGRNGYQFYSAEMGEQSRHRVETEAGLRRAIEREEFQLHYQPQVSLESGAVAGVEALLRWNHPQRGMVPPGSFIPVAEESGLIVPIGEWALRAACRDAAGWAAAGLGEVRVSVNLSARQFWRGSVTEVVRAALGESGLPPSLLEVEITESVLARDLKQVVLALEHLRRMGVQVAIDDFGTGYSSLAYLRSLPIQKLKIDRSFIHGIPADPEATALVGEIVRLAHVLSLTVVAEGVETPEQAAFLRDAGCEAMQGFLFARPMTSPDFAALLRSGRKLPL